MALLPESFTDAYQWAKNRLIYMAGRGVFVMGLFSAAAATGMGAAGAIPMIVPILAVGVSMGLQAWMTHRSERHAEGRLVTIYRKEIATALGKNPADIDVQDLRALADGIPSQNRPDNPIFKQELERTSARHMLRLVTMGVAGLVTAAALTIFPGFTEMIGDLVNNSKLILADTLALDKLTGAAGALGSTAALSGIIFMSGTVMGLINAAVDMVAERVMGLHRPTTHELIQDIRKDVAGKKLISPERVFGVFVSADPILGRAIKEYFGKPYDRLTGLNQHRALEQFGQLYPVAELASQINNHDLSPTELAFAAVGQESGVKPKHKSMGPVEEKGALREIVEGVSHMITQRPVAVDGSALMAEQYAYTAANDNRGMPPAAVDMPASPTGGFVERLRVRPAHMASFADREAQRQAADGIITEPKR